MAKSAGINIKMIVLTRFSNNTAIVTIPIVSLNQTVRYMSYLNQMLGGDLVLYAKRLLAFLSTNIM